MPVKLQIISVVTNSKNALVCRLFHSIACYVEGFDEESRMLRRNLMRYMNLALILVLRYSRLLANYTWDYNVTY